MKTKTFVIKNLLVLSALHLLHACARPGISDEDPAPQMPLPRSAESAGTTDGQLTRVGFDMYPEIAWRYPVCEELSVSPISGLEAPVLDGDLSDWANRTFKISDGEGDDSRGRDITSLGIDLVAGGDLFLGVASARPGVDELHVELGVISAAPKGKFVERSLRYLRLSDGVLEWRQGDAWQPLPGKDLAQAVEGAAVEMQLSRIFIGELMAYPVWFVKVSSRSGEVLNDVISVAYLPGTGGGLDQRLLLKACKIGSSRITLIRERDVSDEMAEDFFGVARLALSKFQKVWQPSQPEIADATFFIGGEGLSLTRESLDDNVVQKNHTASVFSLPKRWIDSSDPHQKTTILRQIILDLSRGAFAAGAPRLSSTLQSAVSRAWAAGWIEEEIGNHHYLSSYWDDVEDFFAGDTTDKARARAWSHVLAATLRPFDLQKAWRDCRSCENDEAYRDALSNSVTSGEEGVVARVWMGWHDGETFDPVFSPDFLRDEDGDGLPWFLEQRIGLSPELVDTDKDGWSDYAEWIFGTDGRNALVHPSTLSADGLLGDWRDLVPTRIKSDPDVSTNECAGAGDIEHYVALADRDAIIVAAQVREPNPDNIPVSFEVVFDLPEERRKFTLQAETGARRWRVQEENGVVKTYAAPYRLGMHGFEMVFRAADFGLGRDLRDERAVNLRLRTSLMRTSEFHCDDTPWFRPLIRDNRP